MAEDEYYPKLCGTCEYYVKKNATRDDHGRLIGRCKMTKRKVSRTDWCHRREEMREHKKAMAAYRGQNYGFD